MDDADAAIKRRDYATAVRLIRPLAEQGNANAQYSLGVFYDNGLGVPQDCRRRKVEKVRQTEAGAIADFGQGSPADKFEASKPLCAAQHR